jgi:pyruvate formate lyase activating enzyme
MKIGSIKKSSLIDYPGKIAAVIGSQGCNLRCRWCHNHYLIPYEYTKESHPIEEGDFLDFLAHRRRFLDAVVITGGEPTLHPDLPELCQKIKRLGYLVKLDTNGTNPEMLAQLIKADLLDYIAMDIKTDLNQYTRLFREKIDVNTITDSIHILLSSAKPHEFRTTCVDPFVSLDNMDQIGALIEGARHYYFQQCIPPQTVKVPCTYRILAEDEIIQLAQIAARYVVNCEIR